ncbi:MAG TPA: cation:proton antiporter family protein [Acidimicrobiales bacterium]|nr:cation:proton antiporter family protein [Acidimicrobiales bacterium]
MLDSPFQQIAAVLAVTAAVGFVARRLSQPLIVAYIAVGILVGPVGIGVVEGQEEIAVLAEIGIALLLFVVGLKLDLHLIRTVGPVALASGLGQVAFTSAIGFVLALLLGFAPVTALYIAVALTFSSTIIIVKLLSDKGEMERPHGRIAMGILIVQDLVVVIVMIVLSAFGTDGDASIPIQLGLVVVKGVAFLGGIVVLMRWVLTPLLHRLARTPELLVLFAIAWAVGLAATGEALDFSEEVGAFLAGVSLASTPYREAIGSRLATVRDFLLLFFFIDLGAGLDFGDAGANVAAALVLSLFVLIGNPIIVMTIMGVMRYRRRVSFSTGLTVAQISEFSLIFAALGLSLGHITEAAVGLITTVGLITISMSTYLILNSEAIFERLSPALRIFERNDAREASFGAASDHPPPRVIVVGLGRYGTMVMEQLHEAGVPALGIDNDPDALGRWADDLANTAYGDAEDQDLPEMLPLDDVVWVVSTSGHLPADRALISALRDHGYRGSIAVTSRHPADVDLLEKAGADRVLRPYALAASHLISDLREALAGGSEPSDEAEGPASEV